jgi:6-phosphogluconolactonase
MISILPDFERLSHAAAHYIAARATDAVAARGGFSVALAGGHTPERTYELLATAPFCEQVPWRAVHVFWGDERCVSPDDARSNQRMACARLLDHVPVPQRQIHPIRCAASPTDGARHYQECLQELLGGTGRLDLILLGLGDDGHTASLFPRSTALAEQDRWVASVYVEEQQLHRVTFTAPLINRARAVAFLVAGEKKATALEAVLQGAHNPDEWPAQLIRPADGELRWFVDDAAAVRLKGLVGEKTRGTR